MVSACWLIVGYITTDALVYMVIMVCLPMHMVQFTTSQHTMTFTKFHLGLESKKFVSGEVQDDHRSRSKLKSYDYPSPWPEWSVKWSHHGGCLMLFNVIYAFKNHGVSSLNQRHGNRPPSTSSQALRPTEAGTLAAVRLVTGLYPST